jgi:hypothetical protein
LNTVSIQEFEEITQGKSGVSNVRTTHSPRRRSVCRV